MVNIGWVGLGRLGLPSALTFADHGHQVVGYDVSDWASKVLTGELPPPREAGIERMLEGTSLKLTDSIGEVVAQSEVVFVAVQTPHAPAYGGEMAAPDSRRDFEYGFLVSAVRSVAAAALNQEREVTIVVVSTALPGTFNNHLRPLKNYYTKIIYNPFFIAMGSTIEDLLDPEFVLIGADDPADADIMFDVYDKLHSKSLSVVSVETAELTKVSYNTFISLKILFANMVMEISHKTGADCDDVINVLSKATDRVISPAYMRGGMGDGGACHPRDLIAMSWLSYKLNLSADLMGFAVSAREAQTRWLADLVVEWFELTRLCVVVLGKTYKPDSDLLFGSPSLLLLSMLRQNNIPVASYDPFVDEKTEPNLAILGSAIYVIGTKHSEFPEMGFSQGSVVIDPFGYIPDRDGVTVVRVGRKS